MAGPTDALQDAGFTEAEISGWAQERRSTLSGAGFQDNEIDAYLAGGVTVPDRVPDAVVQRVADKSLLADIGDFASHGLDTIMKNEPDRAVGDAVYEFAIKNGMSPEAAKLERETIEGRMQRGNVLLLAGPLELAASPLLGAYRHFVSRPLEEQTGAPMEVTEAFSMIAAAVFGIGRGVLRRPGGAPIGPLPESQDFVNAAKAIGSDDIAPQEKMLRLYDERGLHPAEVADAAQSDPVVAQKVLSSEPDDLPGGPPKPPKPPEPPAAKEPPPPPEPPAGPPESFEDAQSRVLDKISVGDREQSNFSLRKLYTAAVDDLHPLKEVDNTAYEMARLTRGQFGKAEQFLEHGTFDFKTYETTGKGLKDILDPVKDDLDGLRAYLASKRALEIKASERASGIDTAAAKIVAEQGEARFAKTASELLGYQNSLIKYLRDSGVLSDKSFDAMVQASQSYVPFYRVFFPDAGAPGSKGFGPGNPVKALKGSERGIIDPLESIIKNTYAYISVAERNAVGIKLIDALREQGFKSVKPPKLLAGAEAELIDHLKQSGVADAESLVDFVKVTAADEGTTIRAWRDGKAEAIETNDQPLVQAFRALDQESANMVIKVLAVPARMLRAGAVLTPDFMARNLIRDFMTAFVNSKGLFSPIDTAKGLASVITKDADFQNWLKSGGANSAMVALDRRYMQESLSKLDADTGLMSRTWNIAKNPLVPLRMASELIENATRVGEFKKVAAGSTEKADLQAAGYASREVTLDFARIGARMRAMNMITAFFNAQVQGVDRIGRAFAERPVNTTAKIAAGITLPSMLLWFANHDDPRYQELPDWQKDLFWIVLTKDHIWRIPKPFELGVVFGSGVERALDATIGQNNEAFNGFAKSVAQAFTPSYIPTAALPVVEQFANRSSFTDRTLIPADVEKQLPEYQYTPYTTELARALGRVVSVFPGMRETAVQPGALMGPGARALTSPVLIENYIRAWTGGMGTYALQAADYSLRKAGVLPDPITPTPTLADIPFIKAFAVRYPSAGMESIQRFYDDYERNKRYFDTFMAKAQEGDAKAVDRIQAAGGPMMFVQLDGIKQTLSEHSKLIRDVYKAPDMKPQEKRQIIDGLYYAMIQIGQEGRKALKQAEGLLAPAPENAR
jgi:hypothetical protein